jgi:hypothetical protein
MPNRHSGKFSTWAGSTQVLESWMQSEVFRQILCIPGPLHHPGGGLCSAADHAGTCLTTQLLCMVCHPAVRDMKVLFFSQLDVIWLQVLSGLLLLVPHNDEEGRMIMTPHLWAATEIGNNGSGPGECNFFILDHGSYNYYPGTCNCAGCLCCIPKCCCPWQVGAQPPKKWREIAYLFCTQMLTLTACAVPSSVLEGNIELLVSRSLLLMNLVSEQLFPILRHHGRIHDSIVAAWYDQYTACSYCVLVHLRNVRSNLDIWCALVQIVLTYLRACFQFRPPRL